jgi:transcription elongation GreA/GreB family factor
VNFFLPEWFLPRAAPVERIAFCWRNSHIIGPSAGDEPRWRPQREESNGTIMSRAFVKERDGDDALDELPERPISPHPNLVTAEGLAYIDAEIARLQQQHAAAQAANDRGALARSARDLRYWTARRSTARVVPPPTDSSRVQFGSTVTIVRDDERRQTFRIVGEDEADPARGTLSHVSPLARALFGKQVGDSVQAGQSEAEIVEVA